MKSFRFTIIELLLVMGIAAIMLAIAVPSFSRIMRGSSTGLAARELIGKINAARAYAASNKTDVAIIFPLKQDHGPTSLQYNSFRICEVIIDDSASPVSFTFKRWIKGENWQFLPKGVLIGIDKNNDDETFFESKQPASNPLDEGHPKNSTAKAAQTVNGVTDSAKSITSKNFSNGIVIRKDGMLYNMTPVLMKLRQGTVDHNGNATLTVPTDEYLPLVVRFNGKVKAFREIIQD